VSVEEVSGSSDVVMDVNLVPMLPDFKINYWCEDAFVLSANPRELSILPLVVSELSLTKFPSSKSESSYLGKLCALPLASVS
jgi:hypothetical protein